MTEENKPAPRRHSSFSGQIGIARADITPPVGVYSRNWGAAKQDVAESIHRPLELTVLTLAAGETSLPLILIDADLGWWRPLSLFRKFQERLLDEFSLDSSRLIFALTHTHAAAPLMDPDPELPGNDLLQQWQETVFKKVVVTIHTALNETFPGTLDWHTGTCNLAAVRDLPDPNGERYLCGFNPEKEADTTLVVGRVTDRDEKVRAVIVNYACHPTTLAWENTAISPDYIGAMREVIESATGATAFFLQGASGDLAPRQQYVGDVEVADRHGRQLGHAALATLYDMNPPGTQLGYSGVIESGAPLAVWKPVAVKLSRQFAGLETSVELTIKDWPSAEELEEQRLACADRALAERLRRKRDIRRALGDGTTFSLPIAIWRVGDAIFVGCCCEAYSILQQQLRARFPERSVVCMNLINGSIGYLPPEEMYDTDVYPVWQTPFARGSLERVIDAMTAGIEKVLG